jgi:serine/threonine protein kinase
VKEINTGNTWALKVLKIWTVPEHAKKNLLARFRLEYETGKINSPYLVKTHTYGNFKGCPYFTMDYCPNGSLRDRITEGITTKKGTQIAKQLLKGLKTLHENGKIHRDLKPENVLFDQQDNPKLSDFGIAGHLNVQLTVVNDAGKPENVLGSYVYMAPEQLSPVHRNQTLLPAIDIFTFGVICFELFSGGHFPFGPWEKQADMGPYLKRAKQGIITPIKQYNKQLHPVWQEIITQSLCNEPKKRFQQIDQILEKIGHRRTEKATPTSLQLQLQIMNGEESGKTYNLYHHLTKKENKILLIGRATAHFQNDLNIKETLSAYISRHHATMECHQDQHCWVIRDGQWLKETRQWNHSRNGTFVNGIKIDASKGQPLVPGDILTLGNTTLKIIEIN